MSARQENDKAPLQAAKSANDRKREGALVAGSRRTEAFKEKLAEAMRTIEQEILGNKGMYPRSDGKLTPAEVARRAGVIVNSIYHPRHEALKIDVLSFVDRMLELAPSNSAEARQPGPTWEDMYVALVTNYRLDALAWQSEKSVREAAERRIAELENSIASHLETIGRLKHEVAELSKTRSSHSVPRFDHRK